MRPGDAPPPPRAVAVGQLARDLVLLVDRMPEAGTAIDARLRREMLGGKGANQAVGLAQLGVPVSLVAVAGDDQVGDDLLDQARRDGIDVSAVVRRAGTPTGLIVDALDAAGEWRYLQHLPDGVLLTGADIDAAAETVRSAEAVLVQLQQPPAATVAAARLGRDAGRLVVLDGAPPADHRAALLAAATVLRTDPQETTLLTGVPADDPEGVRHVARELLARGPSLLALAVDSGNLFLWRDERWGAGELLVPLTEEPVVDTTGAGDAFTAALTTALLRGDPPPVAATYAVAAAGATVDHPGGRPDLDDETVRRRAAGLDRQLVARAPSPVGWV